MHVPWGASSFYLKYSFAAIINLYFTWYLLLWVILWEWWFHVCAPYFSMQIVYFVHKPWGASAYYLEHSSWSYHNIFHLVRWFIWLLASFVEASSPSYPFAIFDPQYSLISSEYSSLDTCIWFHSHYEKCTPYGGTLTILAF